MPWQSFTFWPLHALVAQPSRTWKIHGDTTGAPAGCSSAAAITAIDAWFAAFNAADSTGFARATPTNARHFGVFSTGKFTPADTFVQIASLGELVRYSRVRARQHERMTLEAVQFYGWIRRRLGFTPIFQRSADDLGPKRLAGIGKAEYLCGEGIWVLNLAPRPRDIIIPMK